jgi:hypothetical protein
LYLVHEYEVRKPPKRLSNRRIFSHFRAVVAEYQYATTYRGIRCYKYSADFGDTSADPELKCFCRTPTTCLKKGVHDVSRCAGENYCT